MFLDGMLYVILMSAIEFCIMEFSDKHLWLTTDYATNQVLSYNQLEDKRLDAIINILFLFSFISIYLTSRFHVAVRLFSNRSDGIKML